MAKLIRQNVSTVVEVFLVESSDGVTGKTGLVDGDFTVKEIRKEGGAFAEIDGAITEVGYGWYSFPLSTGASETDTPGNILAHLEAPGTLDFDAVVAQVGWENLVADQVWDEPASGHLAGGSTGEALYNLLNGTIVRRSVAVSGGGGNNTIELDAGASAVNDSYYGMVIWHAEGGRPQSRVIVDYDGTTKIATVDRDWDVNPAVGTTFTIVASHNTWTFVPDTNIPGSMYEHINTIEGEVTAHTTTLLTVTNSLQVQSGLAQAGGANTITLAASASATDGIYNGMIVHITAGTGDLQARQIINYNGTTKVATVNRLWEIQPINGTTYRIHPFSPLLASEIRGRVRKV